MLESWQFALITLALLLLLLVEHDNLKRDSWRSPGLFWVVVFILAVSAVATVLRWVAENTP